MRTGLDLRAIAIGAAVDIGGSILIGGALFAIAGSMLGASDAEEMSELFATSLELQIFSLVIGLLFVALGAFIAGRIARRDEVSHGFAVGVISAIVSFTCVFMDPGASPFWFQAVALILTIPSGFLGGWIASMLRSGPPAVP